MSRRVVACALALALVAGCGGRGSSSTTTSSTTTPSTSTTSTSTTAPTAVATMVTSAPVPIGSPSTTAAVPVTTTAGSAPAVPTAAPTSAAPGSSTTTPVAPADLVMRANGLGAAVFGADPDEVIATITAAVGPPTRDSGWMDPLSLGSCPGTEVRSVQFGDLTLDFGDESAVLTGRPHFFAYSYGPPTGATAVPAGLAIDGGGTIGTTVAALRSAHPAVQLYPADATAPASFAISDGLTGVLTGTTDAATITKVQGGIGCGE